MDADLARWLATFAPLDDAPASARFGLDAQGLVTVALAPAFERKPKLRTTWRAKDEIERLRQLAADLEETVSLHAQRRREMSQMAYSRSWDEPAGGKGAWKGVALRERRRLRASLHENGRLVTLVQREVARGHQLARIIQNPKRQCYTAILRSPTPLDDAVVLRKHQELIAAVSVTFQSLEGVLGDSSTRLPGEEFRSSQRFAALSDPTVTPGMVLAQSGARRLVPLELSELGDKLWGSFQTTEIDAMRGQDHVQYAERLPQSHILVESIQIPTDEGTALFRVMGVRARFPSGSCDVTVAVASLWPDASAPASAQSTTLDVRSWTIAQPHGTSVGLSEVRFHADVSLALGPSCTRSPDTPPQASYLDDLVARVQSRMLTKNDLLLDAMLLSQ